MYRIIFALILVLSFPFTSNAAEEFIAKIHPVLDESISTAPYPGSWNQQQPSVFGRLPNSRDGALDAYAATRSTSMGWIGIFRTFLSFDLSVIPNEADISSIKLVVFPKYVVNDINDSYSYMGLYRSYQASSTNLSFDDIELCGDSITNPNELAKVNLNDLSPNTENNFEFSSEEADLLSDSRYLSLCLRVGHDSDNQEIRNNNTSYWRSSGIVIYGTKSQENYFQPYLEITYTVPEEEVTVASGVDKLKEYIAGLVNKAQRNSYTAQVKNILGFFETGKFTAALNQLGALLKKVEVDTAEGQLPPEVTEGITETATAIEEVIEAAATEREVPLMTQIASPYPPESAEWADDVYGDGTPDWCGSTIGGCGCALTSLAMLGQYYGITKGYDGTTVNPGNFNTWLQNNNGYTELNTIRWYYGLQYLSPALGYSTLQLDALNSTNKDEVATAVAAGSPSIAFKKSKGHYFVLSDVLADGNYAVRDPFWYMTQTLNDTKDIAGHVQGYGGTFDQANLYSHTNAQRPFPRWVEIQLGSPAELLITDGQGRRTGYDPETGEILNEIPGSTYAQAAGVVTRDQVGADVHLPKVLAITAPEDDVFTLEVIGTGVGGYTLSVDTGGGYGDSEITAIEDTTTPGQVDAYVIDVPVRQSSDRAVTRLRELADAKEALQPSVAERLREVAERLMNRNVEAVTEDVATALK